MRGLLDVSKLAAAAALMLVVSGPGTFGCSGQDSGVDAAPPVEGDLVELDVDMDDMGDVDEIQEQQEEESKY